LSTEVAIIGGGICGSSAAAFLAEAGVSVTLYERAEIAAAASGRNSGALQQPLDAPLGALHAESIELYRELAQRAAGFDLAARPAGLLMVSADHTALAHACEAVGAVTPELAPEVISAGELQRLEPQLAGDLGACRIETGYPVAPASATLAYARRARRAGATIVTGIEARPRVTPDGRVAGLTTGTGEHVTAGQVLLTAGPWTSELFSGWTAMTPIRSLWGVVVGVELADPPRHVIEELGIDGGVAGADRLFSLVHAEGSTSVGSTFLDGIPDPQAEAELIISRASRFVPALASAQVTGVRACARPLSFDGRPLIGPVPETDGLFVCAGHGPWGISTGPASARLIVDQMLGRSGLIAEFDPARVSTRTG
jgi:glycine oxidase